jgi:hypothetical protein
MVYMYESFSYLAILYFVPIVFIGAFFLLNLTLAVIKSKFTEEHKAKSKNKGAKKKIKTLDDVENEDLLDAPARERKKKERRNVLDRMALNLRRMMFIKRVFKKKLLQIRQKRRNRQEDLEIEYDNQLK